MIYWVTCGTKALNDMNLSEVRSCERSYRGHFALTRAALAYGFACLKALFHRDIVFVSLDSQKRAYGVTQPVHTWNRPAPRTRKVRGF